MDDANRNGTGQEPPAAIPAENPPASRPLPALRRRRLWRKYRWTLWLLLMIPVVYAVVQVFIVLSPRTRTDVVKLGSMTDSMTVTGQVVLESQPITSDAGGYMYYTVGNGQRVAAGAEVALLFADERGVEAMDRLHVVEQELAMLQEAQQTVAEGGDLENLLAQMQTSLYSVLRAIGTADYQNLTQARQALTLAANKMQIATGEAGSFDAYMMQMNALKAQLESMAAPVGSVTAPQGGYFVASALQDRIPLSHDEIAALAPAQFQAALQAEPSYYGADVVGHIVLDYKWNFLAAAPAKEGERFVVGDKSLRLAFPDYGTLEVPVQVNAVRTDEESDVAVIELYCDNVSAEVMALRVEQAEIVFSVEKGIRIPRQALRLVDVTQEDGSVSTYRGVYVEFGNMVYFRRVQIIIEDEYYMLVPLEYVAEVNEVQLYDVVVVDPGGVELYDRKIL